MCAGLFEGNCRGGAVWVCVQGCVGGELWEWSCAQLYGVVIASTYHLCSVHVLCVSVLFVITCCVYPACLCGSVLCDRSTLSTCTLEVDMALLSVSRLTHGTWSL